MRKGSGFVAQRENAARHAHGKLPCRKYFSGFVLLPIKNREFCRHEEDDCNKVNSLIQLSIQAKQACSDSSSLMADRTKIKKTAAGK